MKMFNDDGKNGKNDGKNGKADGNNGKEDECLGKNDGRSVENVENHGKSGKNDGKPLSESDFGRISQTMLNFKGKNGQNGGKSGENVNENHGKIEDKKYGKGGKNDGNFSSECDFGPTKLNFKGKSEQSQKVEENVEKVENDVEKSILSPKKYSLRLRKRKKDEEIFFNHYLSNFDDDDEENYENDEVENDDDEKKIKTKLKMKMKKKKRRRQSDDDEEWQIHQMIDDENAEENDYYDDDDDYDFDDDYYDKKTKKKKKKLNNKRRKRQSDSCGDNFDIYDNNYCDRFDNFDRPSDSDEMMMIRSGEGKRNVGDRRRGRGRGRGREMRTRRGKNEKNVEEEKNNGSRSDNVDKDGENEGIDDKNGKKSTFFQEKCEISINYIEANFPTNIDSKSIDTNFSYENGPIDFEDVIRADVVINNKKKFSKNDDLEEENFDDDRLYSGRRTISRSLIKPAGRGRGGGRRQPANRKKQKTTTTTTTNQNCTKSSTITNGSCRSSKSSCSCKSGGGGGGGDNDDQLEVRLDPSNVIIRTIGDDYYEMKGENPMEKMEMEVEKMEGVVLTSNGPNLRKKPSLTNKNAARFSTSATSIFLPPLPPSSSSSSSSSTSNIRLATTFTPTTNITSTPNTTITSTTMAMEGMEGREKYFLSSTSFNPFSSTQLEKNDIIDEKEMEILMSDEYLLNNCFSMSVSEFLEEKKQQKEREIMDDDFGVVGLVDRVVDGVAGLEVDGVVVERAVGGVGVAETIQPIYDYNDDEDDDDVIIVEKKPEIIVLDDDDDD